MNTRSILDPSKVPQILKGFRPPSLCSPMNSYPQKTSPSTPRQLLNHLFHFVLAWLMACGFGVSFGGAGPSEWVVVVNGSSVNSRTLANHFCALRNIPFRNVIVLDSVPDQDRIEIEVFREKILVPVIREIEGRGLASTVQGIAYSCDMPTAIALDSDLAQIQDRNKFLTPVGSISGLTYLFRRVLNKDPTYLAFDSNWFAAREGNALLNLYTGSLEERKELQRWLDTGEHEQAAKRLDAMGQMVESSFPLDYLSARQWALAGDAVKAKNRLSSAIRKGWRYRREISDDSAFDSLREDSEFQRLVSRCPNDDFRYLPTRGFDARSFYAPNTLASTRANQGFSYLMSVMLSVTRDQGIPMPQAIAHLERSAAADYSRPTGTFFFTSTSDVRTIAREPNFELAIEKLRNLKFDAQIIKQPLPGVGQKCSGVMFGIAQFDWARTGAELMPGSIAESLTSFGGVMTESSQTKATELLRFGAAASSGTVTEPYSIQNKFPHPMMHVHYGQGLTVAESFYQSVLCPYQLLILGDPLCQPYAEPPRFTIRGIESGARASGVIHLDLETSDDDHTSDPVRLIWLVDGLPKSASVFQKRVRVEVSDSDRGAQEWRLIARGPKPLEHRFEQSLWVLTGPEESDFAIEAPGQWSVQEGATLRVTFKNPPADGSIAIRHDWEIVAEQSVSQSVFELDPKQLGLGPVRLQGVVLGQDGRAVQSSLPITVQILK